MPKGKIVALVSPWEDIKITRNGIVFNLIPVENNRGEGTFPGLSGANVQDNPPNFEIWTDNGKDVPPVEPTAEQLSKLTETEKTELLKKYTDDLKVFTEYRALKYSQRIADFFNTELRNCWRDAATGLKLTKDKQDKLSDTDKTKLVETFTANVNEYLSAIKGEREKDSAYYAKRISETNDKLKPLIAKAKGKLANLSAEEQKQYSTLKTLREEYTTLRDAKLAEENAAAEMLIEDLE